MWAMSMCYAKCHDVQCLSHYIVVCVKKNTKLATSGCDIVGHLRI